MHTVISVGYGVNQRLTTGLLRINELGFKSCAFTKLRSLDEERSPQEIPTSNPQFENIPVFCDVLLHVVTVARPYLVPENSKNPELAPRMPPSDIFGK